MKGWADIARAAQLHWLVPGLTMREWPGDGPRVMLVHGGSGSWLHWLPVLPALIGRFHLFAPDLPGFGSSGAAAHRDADDVSQGLRAAIDWVGDIQGIVAFSFGAAIAARALDGVSGGAGLHVIAPAGFGQSHLAPGLLRRRPSGAARRAVDRHNLVQAMLTPERGAQPGLERLYGCCLDQARFDSRPVSFSRDCEDRLPGLRLRSALWAGRDAFIAPDMSRRQALIREAHPGAAQAVLPEAGHWMMAEDPDGVAGWLIRQIAG